jgi:hypothetical protein
LDVLTSLSIAQYDWFAHANIEGEAAVEAHSPRGFWSRWIGPGVKAAEQPLAHHSGYVDVAERPLIFHQQQFKTQGKKSET